MRAARVLMIRAVRELEPEFDVTAGESLRPRRVEIEREVRVPTYAVPVGWVGTHERWKSRTVAQLGMRPAAVPGSEDRRPQGPRCQLRLVLMACG